jgi:undecaprenyl-diphosphatase
VDWAIVHDLNELMRTQDVVEDSVVVFASAAVVAYAMATIALWFVARPAGVQRLRLACTAALGSAALGLFANQLIGQLWFRDRPYVDHPRSLVLFTPTSHDPSFPSDHATAAFAIAVAVFFFHRRIGAVFLVAAAAIAVSRVLLGMHYPTDVLVGALTGTSAAMTVCTLGRPLLVRVTTMAARLTDPVLRRLWSAASRLVQT